MGTPGDFPGVEAIGGPCCLPTTLSFLPQALRIWRNGSTRDVSLAMYLMMFAGQVMWLTYGVVIGSASLIFSNVSALLLVGSVLVLQAARPDGRQSGPARRALAAKRCIVAGFGWATFAVEISKDRQAVVLSKGEQFAAAPKGNPGCWACRSAHCRRQRSHRSARRQVPRMVARCGMKRPVQVIGDHDPGKAAVCQRPGRSVFEIGSQDLDLPVPRRHALSQGRQAL